MTAKSCVNTGELLLANKHIANNVFNLRFLNHSFHNDTKDAYDSNIWAVEKKVQTLLIARKR